MADAELLAIGPRLGGFAFQPFLAAEGQQPALLADQCLGLRTRLVHQALHGRGSNGRSAAHSSAPPAGSFRARRPTSSAPGRRQPGQSQRFVAGGGGQVQPHLHQRVQVARKGMRPHTLALDDAGIAETGFATRLALVDQRHAAAAPQQVDASCNADNAGAQDDGVVVIFVSALFPR